MTQTGHLHARRDSLYFLGYHSRLCNGMKSLSPCKPLALIACWFACGISPRLSAQTLTSVTDSTNPIVTDSYESGGGSWVDVNRDGNLDLFVDRKSTRPNSSNG